MSQTVILGTARTPFAKMGGALSSKSAVELGGTAIAAALERSEVAPDQVQQVIYGQVLQAGQGQIPSRQAQIEAGIPREVPSETINKVCASGMRAIGLADQAIRADDVELAVTGGMESMSGAPYLLPGARFGFRMGDVQAIDAMTHDGLTNPFTDKQMINEASEVAAELELTRADMDRWAARSHQLAAKATDEGRLAEEIVGVTVKTRKEETEVVARRGDPAGDHRGGAGEAEADRWPRRHPHGRQRPRRQRRRRRRRRRLRGVGEARGSPAAGSGPLLRHGRRRLRLPRPDAGGGREAGAREDRQARPPTSTSGRSTRRSPRWRSTRCGCSGVDEEKVNVNGGAIALGHPIGASGARIVGALVHELRRRGGGLGCAAICSGGGQGDAIVLEVNGA